MGFWFGFSAWDLLLELQAVFHTGFAVVLAINCRGCLKRRNMPGLDLERMCRALCRDGGTYGTKPRPDRRRAWASDVPALVGYVFFRSMVMVSTTAVFFRRCATLTVINCPVFASRPLVIVYVFLRFAILCYLIYGILPTSRRRPDAPPYNTAYA